MPEYAWQFRIVNSAEINAFALPGGYIYVNRGVFEAAENEAQLAGVIAHESGHVVMRHGTHIASQAVLAQGGLAILTSIFGQSGSLTSQLAQLGLGLGVDSLLLKNSRTAETQADEVGTYILYQAGYDPHAMVQFFQIIARKYPQRTLQFFSDHPNPENRIKDVDAEIAQLGPPRGTKTDSPEFEGVKQYLAALASTARRTKARQKSTPRSNPLPCPPRTWFVTMARYLPSTTLTTGRCSAMRIAWRCFPRGDGDGRRGGNRAGLRRGGEPLHAPAGELGACGCDAGTHRVDAAVESPNARLAANRHEPARQPGRQHPACRMIPRLRDRGKLTIW